MSITVDAKTSRSRLGKQLARVALGLAAFALASSVLATPGRSSSNRESAASQSALAGETQVVVLTLDGARFCEIFEGVDAELAREQHLPEARLLAAAELMPELHRLLESGAALGAPGHGATISASGPEFVSLPGYSEIFSGRRVTGCWNNGCQGSAAPSIADSLAEHLPGSAKVAVITSWPDIARVAAKGARVAVSAGKHAGATRQRFELQGAVGAALGRAETEAAWPGHGDFRRDRFTAELALTYLAVEQPAFLFVGLGETDEFAHQGNYAGYLDALVEADHVIGKLAASLAERARHGVRTALFVTADHGRAKSFREHGQPFPESARVWLVASGSAIEARGFVAAPRGRRLADIAPTLRTLFGLPADRDENAGSPLTELLGLTERAGG